MKLLNSFLKNELKNSSYLKYTLPIKNYYLVKWYPRASSKIHNHNGKQCNFMILNGSLNESRFRTEEKSDIIGTQLLNPFKIYKINDTEGYHQMFNLGYKNKWSIHKYY